MYYYLSYYWRCFAALFKKAAKNRQRLRILKELEKIDIRNEFATESKNLSLYREKLFKIARSNDGNPIRDR